MKRKFDALIFVNKTNKKITIKFRKHQLEIKHYKFLKQKHM